MPEHPSLSHENEPELRKPVMVSAFRGWNDAGDAASFAAQHLARVWSAKKFASIDPEEFFDFQAVRPQVSLKDGVTRYITWPSNEFWAATPEGAEHDVIVLVGTEPNLRWRTFSRVVVDVARRYDVELVITLGALLADVPHSRPVHITGTAVDPELVERLGLVRSRYEGPTGIVGVLHDALGGAGVASASIWAAVPHYLAVNPNPKAALALVRKTLELVDAPAPVDDLERATTVYERRVSDMVASDDDVQAYVRLLEERADERELEEIDPSRLPSGDALAAELERFLRERTEGDGPQG
ncbi:MAG TPA: PAC2 family protein [Actinomycetota bacterium]|nr:PAC2 family protein [Actinomycetota bacterium]